MPANGIPSRANPAMVASEPTEKMLSGVGILVVAKGLRERYGTYLAFAVGAAGEPAHFYAVSMVGMVGADDASTAGSGSRHHQRDLVGLGAGAGEYRTLDGAVVEAGEPLRVVHDTVVQVTTMHVEGRHLARHRLDHVRVTVTDARHIVVHVDVSAAIRPKQRHPLAAHDVHRFLIEQRGARSEKSIPALRQVSLLVH